MFLTNEGALLALTLAALVCGLLGAWAVLQLALRKPSAEKTAGGADKVGAVRGVAVPAGTAPKV
jgi:hypothetical protein